MGCIDHQPFIVRLNYEHLKESFPNAPVSPTTEPAMGIFPVSKVRRQIAPWCSRPQYPEYRVDKQSVIISRATNASLFTGEMRLYIFPDPVTNIMSSMRVHSLSCHV